MAVAPGPEFFKIVVVGTNSGANREGLEQWRRLGCGDSGIFPSLLVINPI